MSFAHIFPSYVSQLDFNMIFISCLFAVCGEVQNSGNKMPWLVSLGGYLSPTKWDHQCAGSLVTNKHILTSASCLLKSKNEWIDGRKIRFGTPNILDPSKGFERNIISTNIHPDRANVFYFDVGSGVLHKIISFSQNAMPVCLPMRPIGNSKI